MGEAITTEFHKFLVDRNGVPYKSFGLDTPCNVIEVCFRLIYIHRDICKCKIFLMYEYI